MSFANAHQLDVPIWRERKSILNVRRLGGSVRTKLRDPEWFWSKLGPNWETAIRIDLSQSPIFNSDIECLRAFRNLETLYLGGTQITDWGLLHLIGLRNLKTLWLAETDVSDWGVRTLSHLTDLQELNIKGTQIGILGRSMLNQLLPSCKLIW